MTKVEYIKKLTKNTSILEEKEIYYSFEDGLRVSFKSSGYKCTLFDSLGMVKAIDIISYKEEFNCINVLLASANLLTHHQELQYFEEANSINTLVDVYSFVSNILYPERLKNNVSISSTHKITEYIIHLSINELTLNFHLDSKTHELRSIIINVNAGSFEINSTKEYNIALNYLLRITEAKDKDYSNLIKYLNSHYFYYCIIMPHVSVVI